MRIFLPVIRTNIDSEEIATTRLKLLTSKTIKVIMHTRLLSLREGATLILIPDEDTRKRKWGQILKLYAL